MTFTVGRRGEFHFPLEKSMRKRLVLSVLACATIVCPTGLKADIFTDNFAGPGLDPAWQVLGGQGAYSVGGGQLRYFNQGPLSSPNIWNTTSLALALPFTGSNWELDIKAAYNLDWCLSGSYTGPSNPNTSCSSGAQSPQVIVSFDPVTSSNRSAMGGTNYANFSRSIDAWYGSNSLVASYGAASSSNLLDPADSIISNNIAGGTYWLQLIRMGGTLTMNYSEDGLNYSTGLTASLTNPAGTYNELLLTGTTFLTAGSFTDFSGLDIKTAIEPTPEPASLVFLGTMVAAILLAKRNYHFGSHGKI